MAGCGYVCPLCEGNGFNAEGEVCEYCKKPQLTMIDEKVEWVNSVHEGPCCGDWTEKNEN